MAMGYRCAGAPSPIGAAWTLDPEARERTVCCCPTICFTMNRGSGPMKSTAFYRCLEEALAAALHEQAFVRQKGRISRWCRHDDHGVLFLQWRIDPKSPWEAWSGGSFFTEAFSTADTGRRWEDVETDVACHVDVFGYWPAADYAAFSALNAAVRDKVAALDPAAVCQRAGFDASAVEVIGGMQETALEIMDGEIAMARSRGLLNPAQFYLDETDVTAWGALMARMLPAIVAGVGAGPR
jgi:hypothetical protein